jgi:hypothetical protein
MVPFLSPVGAALGVKGPLEADRVAAINHAYLLAFFDSYLKGEPSALLDGPTAGTGRRRPAVA